MDLIGDIIEHESSVPTEPVIEPHAAQTGFPELLKFDVKPRTSRFKSAKPKSETPQSSVTSHVPKEEGQRKGKKVGLTEAQRIHQENLEKISSLTEDELTKEREELLKGLDPRLVQTLLKRTEARASEDNHNHNHAEGYDGWIGGGRNGAKLPSLNDKDVDKALGIKSVSFNENIEEFHDHHEDTGHSDCDHEDKDEDEDARHYPLNHFRDNEDDVEVESEPSNADEEVAPDGYQINSESQEQPEMHFPKPKANKDDPELDLDDPNFFENLHEKYFPDLPKETSKLAWMTTPMPQRKITSYEAISDMRFDFKGNLVELDKKSQDLPTHLGLHHHSENPQLAGYTLAELVHLTRSVVPSQRCMGIQMLGRILHKLGLHKYNIMPIIDNEEDGSSDVISQASKQVMEQFEGMMWDLIETLRVIDSLTEASDEKMTRNLSVRNYAIEALWLWKQGGGRPKTEEKTEEEILAENLHNM